MPPILIKIKRLIIAKSYSFTEKKKSGEKLYVIESFTYDGLLIYTKGTIKKDYQGQEVYYLLISSKRSTSIRCGL